MHYHKYSKWKPFTYEWIHYIKPHKIRLVKQMEQRKCKKCGKVQEREKEER